MNEQLYSEILYKTLNFRGCDAEIARLAILEYLQKVSEVEDTRHSHLLEAAKMRKVNAIYFSGVQDVEPVSAL
jgi:hypothetical protein